MSVPVVLHIGLHKTGTRYLQRMVFRQLDARAFNVDPQPLWQNLREAVRHPGDREKANALREQARLWRESGDKRTLILSEPHISGDMYSGHHDYADNLALMHELFPEARILYFVRSQADWLQSAYRQQLVKGKAVPMHVFLNFYGGEFRERPARWVYGARTLEALGLRFLDIYRGYAEAFGEENVLLLRQEDLRHRSDAVKAKLAAFLGLEQLPAPPKEEQQNRSYSALAIALFHPGTLVRRGAPTMTDTGQKKGPIMRKLLRPFRRLRRALVQHGFDRLVYRDWDLLAKNGMRERIEAHYAAENRELERIALKQLEQ